MLRIKLGGQSRIRHDGSSTPTGEIMTDGGAVFLEPGVPEATAEALRGRGHTVHRGGWGFGGYQAILIDDANGVLQGGSDPRKSGCALGF